MINYDSIIEKTKALNPDTIFTIKKLFSEDEWNNLDKGVRIEWGRKFLLEVENNTYPFVSALDKDSANSQKYITKDVHL